MLRELRHAPRARVLVQTEDVATARAVSRTLHLERSFEHVPALAAWITEPELQALRAQSGVRSIALDEGGSGHLAEALPLAGFTPVTAAGLTGQNVTVAIIDSGIDRSHPDLANAIVDEACFCGSGCCPGGLTEAFGEGSAFDDNGHGTHVAGVIAGRGVATGQPGGAPATRVIAIKVLDAFNAFCCTSDLIAALDWLLAQHPEVSVVNMSLGANGLHPADCDGEVTVGPIASAAQALIDRGAVLVASSGNNGLEGLPIPACLSDVISVGAVWDADLGPQAILCSEDSTAADRIACFSNFSPTLDLLAPGAIVTSTWPVGLARGRAGTSQAAPMVSACAALLRGAGPSATPGAIASALRASPTWLIDPRNAIAYPRLDCGAALAALVGSDAGTGPMDAGIDAGQPQLDAAIEAGAALDAEVDGALGASDAALEPDGDAAYAPEPDAALDGGPILSDASGSDAASADDAGRRTDAGSSAIPDAADDSPDALAMDEPDAAESEATAHRADCACRAAGAHRPISRAIGPLWSAIALALALVGRALRRRGARRSR